jgi:hypothetical protein
MFSGAAETAPDGRTTDGEVRQVRDGDRLIVEADLPPFAIRTFRLEEA